jgi:hypothetical protein
MRWAFFEGLFRSFCFVAFCSCAIRKAYTRAHTSHAKSGSAPSGAIRIRGREREREEAALFLKPNAQKSSRHLHALNLHKLLAFVGNRVRNRIHRRPTRFVGCRHFREHAVAPVDLVQMLIRPQIDEELGVSIVRHVEMGYGRSPLQVADPHPARRLIHRQVSVGVLLAASVEAALNHEIASIEGRRVVEACSGTVADVLHGDWRGISPQGQSDAAEGRADEEG